MVRFFVFAMLLSVPSAAASEKQCALASDASCDIGGEDYYSVLQARVGVSPADDLKNKNKEDGGKDTEKTAFLNEKEDDIEQYAMVRDIFGDGMEKTEFLNEKEDDLEQEDDMEGDMEDDMMADNETEVEKEGDLEQEDDEDDMEEEIKDEAAETEDTADEVDDDEKLRRTGKGCAGVKLEGKCFKRAPNFNDVWKLVRNKIGSRLNFLSCSSVNDCKRKYISAAKNAMIGAAQGVINSMMRGGVAKMSDVVMKIVGKTKQMLKDTRGFRDQAFGDFKNAVDGVAKAATKENWGNVCSPAGVGLWELRPTDCGAFGTLRDISRISWRKLHRIPRYFSRLIRQFSQCVGKTQWHFLWTPFHNLYVPTWCLPKIIQTPLEGIVGTLKWAVQQIARGGSCNTVFCTIVKKMTQIGSKFMKLFDEAISSRGFSLLQHLEQVADSMDSESNSNSSRVSPSPQTKQKCQGSDFEVSISPGVGVKFPEGHGLAVSLKLSMGCNRKNFFGDIALVLGGSLYMFGFKKDMATKEFGGGVVIGFNVGRHARSFFSWDAGVAFSGKASVAKMVGDLAIKLKLLPGPSPPRGFTISPKGKADDEPTLLQTRQEEIDAAMAQHETDEDKLAAGLAKSTEQFDDIDLGDAEKTVQLMSAIQDGATATKAHADSEAPPVQLKDIAEHATLNLNFCFTCIPETGGVWYATNKGTGI